VSLAKEMKLRKNNSYRFVFVWIRFNGKPLDVYRSPEFLLGAFLFLDSVFFEEGICHSIQKKRKTFT
jgi:hypothetical protein